MSKNIFSVYWAWVIALLLGFFTPAHADLSNAASSILILGDSLSAEYGLKRGTGWVPLLEKRLQAKNIPIKVINASISGETTSGGLSRLPTLLTQYRPNYVVIELGANDALQGKSIKEISSNLQTLSQLAKKIGSQVILVGMQIPPNYGTRYTQDFKNIFTELASSQQTPIVPFLLKGVADATEPSKWFQADRLHPNEQAQPILLENMWSALGPLLEKNKKGPAEQVAIQNK